MVRWSLKKFIFPFSSLSTGDQEQSDPRNLLPQSPTNYKQPPTPDHPPPSSSQAEKTIHERIRPLSQEYKRRSALIQLQKQQQQMIDMGTSPLRHANLSNSSNYDYAYVQSPTKLNAISNSTTIYSTIESGAIRGSSGSLSSSVSTSDHSASTDNVEEFVGDAPFAGLIKGSIANNRRCEPAYATVNKPRKTSPPQVQLPPSRPQQQLPPQGQIPVYATIHKKRSICASDQLLQKPRPPIPAKPVVPERRLFKAQPPQLPTSSKISPTKRETTTNNANNDEDHVMKNSCPETSEDKTSVSKILQEEEDSLKDSAQTQETNLEASDKLSHQSSLNSSSNEEQAQQNTQNHNESSNEESTTTTATTTTSTSHESSILSPFNAEEARKKISEIIESFGSGILNSNISPTNDIDLDFDDLENPTERQVLISRLRSAGLFHLERILFENGYDNYKFMVPSI